ncbi:hypothetical protein FDZ71_16565 [bacterium]|nr:MAG: hypothetical protein FDZ71_16565 [bacterium]
MKRFSIFLIVVVLIVSMVGCGNSGGDNGGNGGNGSNGGDNGESYTLTVDSTAGGAVAVNNVTIPGKAIFTYDAGTVVSLNATPDSGYQFVKWTGDVGTVDDVHDSEIIITVNGNYSIMANFEIPPPVQYSLTIFSTAGGSVTTPGEGRFTYDEGIMVNLVAKPTSGYKFAKWTGDVENIADINATSTNITMNGNYYIAANFRDIPCTGLG